MKKKKEEHTSELKEQPRGSRLEKKDSQERELCMEQKIKRREQSIATFKKDNSCVRAKKNKKFFSSAVRHTQVFL